MVADTTTRMLSPSPQCALQILVLCMWVLLLVLPIRSVVWPSSSSSDMKGGLGGADVAGIRTSGDEEHHIDEDARNPYDKWHAFLLSKTGVEHSAIVQPRARGSGLSVYYYRILIKYLLSRL